MVIDMSGVIISGQRLEKMVDFLFEISDRVDLIRSGYDEMTKDEYETASEEREYLHKEMDHANGLTDEEIDEMLNGCIDCGDMTEEEKQEQIDIRQKIKDAEEKEILVRDTSCIKAEEIKAKVEEKFAGLVCMKRRVTCQTHCTLGGVAVVYSFPISEELKKHFLQMEVLTWPLKTKESEFLADDPAFYRQGEQVCSICSHEGYITLYLNEEQLKKFEEFGIPFYLDRAKTEQKKQDFPFFKETVCVFSMGSAVSTLLGQGLFDLIYENKSIKDYLEFFHWFDENQDTLRTQTKPCRKSTQDIVAHLQREYSLQPFSSKAIERQCQRHGWDAFFSKPWNTNSQQTMPEFETFLYRLNYQGEELIVGGEYNSDYLFIDTINAENKLNNLVENRDQRICGFTEQSDLTEPLFQLMREINSYRGIDEYEKYDFGFFRTYIQTLRYVDGKTNRYLTPIETN